MVRLDRVQQKADCACNSPYRGLNNTIKRRTMKSKFNIYLTLFLVIIGVFVTTGSSCRGDRLEPGGAYAPVLTNIDGTVTPTAAPDLPFFIVDSSYDLAYSTILTLANMERDNRLFFWAISPDIKHTLDKWRPEIVRINVEYHRARIAYKANPTPAGLSGLETFLGRLSQVTSALGPIQQTMNQKLVQLKANPSLNP